MKVEERIKLPARSWVVVVAVLGFLFTLLLITYILLGE